VDELGGGGHERSLEGEGRWLKRKATCRGEGGRWNGTGNIRGRR
jgi:hypothetical protein